MTAALQVVHRKGLPAGVERCAGKGRRMCITAKHDSEQGWTSLRPERPRLHENGVGARVGKRTSGSSEHHSAVLTGCAKCHDIAAGASHAFGVKVRVWPWAAAMV